MLATDRDGNGLIKYAYSGNFNALRNTGHCPGELVGHRQFRLRGRLQQCPGLPPLGQMAAAADSIGRRGDATRWSRRRKD